MENVMNQVQKSVEDRWAWIESLMSRGKGEDSQEYTDASRDLLKWVTYRGSLVMETLPSRLIENDAFNEWCERWVGR